MGFAGETLFTDRHPRRAARAPRAVSQASSPGSSVAGRSAAGHGARVTEGTRSEARKWLWCTASTTCGTNGASSRSTVQSVS